MNELKNKHPEIIVFAGPNGSGKSTFTELLKPAMMDYINADDIKRTTLCTDMEAAITADELRNKLIDNGESFTIRSIIPFNSTKYTYYGNICFTPSGDIYAYCYDECDENNLKMVVSKDKGYSWGKQHRVYFENRIRNPQICYFGGKYLAHGRSGSMGPNPGHFILYCSDDGVNWDEGRILRKCEHGAGAYSNKIIVHNPSGKDRLMIQTSHAYEKNKTNTIMFWVDEK